MYKTEETLLLRFASQDAPVLSRTAARKPHAPRLPGGHTHRCCQAVVRITAAGKLYRSRLRNMSR
eukprot:286106-Chlamydomonas_euryale.AAC.2